VVELRDEEVRELCLRLRLTPLHLPAASVWLDATHRPDVWWQSGL